MSSWEQSSTSRRYAGLGSLSISRKNGCQKWPPVKWPCASSVNLMHRPWKHAPCFFQGTSVVNMTLAANWRTTRTARGARFLKEISSIENMYLETDNADVSAINRSVRYTYYIYVLRTHVGTPCPFSWLEGWWTLCCDVEAHRSILRPLLLMEMVEPI